MKSERRHELKTNTLAQGIGGLPEYWRVYGGRVLLGVVAVLALILFFRFRAQNAEREHEQAREANATALQGVANLQSIAQLSDPRQAADQRKQLQENVERAIDQVLENSPDEALKAEALVTRGNLYWSLAHLPEIRGAETQPSLRMTQRPDELLDKARKAYEAAVATAGAKPLSVVTARLALASVAEERKQWDEARKQYETIKSDPNTPEAFRPEAEFHLEQLKQISTPILLGRPATEPARPAATPLGPEGPELLTSMRSSTQPAAPTTAPK